MPCLSNSDIYGYKSDMVATSPRVLGLLLIDDFALMSYSSVVEPYRAANILAGRTLYRWVHIAARDRSCRASNGAIFLADQRAGEPLACDTLFVFAGGDPAGFSDRKTLAWLRKIAAQGTTIAGISAGPYILAQAGLLHGYRATIHWEHRTAFQEKFPEYSVEDGLYVIDRQRMTCAGGMAGMDLAIELIAREQGHDLAAQVSDWFIRSEQRGADEPQRLSLRERYGVNSPHLLKTLAHMEAHVEEPASRDELARLAKISVRQLERLFRDGLGATIGESYMTIRLAQAEQLLRATSLSVTEVALACGFRSLSHFSRRFLQHYGRSPRHRAGR